jgi:hypothetical protein
LHIESLTVVVMTWPKPMCLLESVSGEQVAG